MLEQVGVLTLNEQIDRLGLKIARPLNIQTPDDSLEALANGIEKRNLETEDFKLNEMVNYFSNSENIRPYEICVLLDGSITGYVDLLERIKLDSRLETYQNRINFRFVFKTEEPGSQKRGMVTYSTHDIENLKNYKPVRTAFDDIWDSGMTAALPLAIQLNEKDLKFHAHSRKLSSPQFVPPNRIENENSAVLTTPDKYLVLFDDEWVYGSCGMNSSRYPDEDWEVNAEERVNMLPLTHQWEGSFNPNNRSDYLKLLQGLRRLKLPRNIQIKMMIFQRLALADRKIDEMMKIHNELVDGTNLPKFSTIES